jgi:hypothetical protein
MYNSYKGHCQDVKTLLEMSLVSIDDMDAVSSFALAHTLHEPALTMPAHFDLARQDGHTMLDYAKIGLRRCPDDQGNKDTIAFLESCLFLPP